MTAPAGAGRRFHVVIRWRGTNRFSGRDSAVQKENAMITAIVMIKCEIGKVNSVAEALVNLDGVAEVYSISGEHDLMCIVRVKEYDAMATTVADDIARLNGIAKTTTHMAFRCYSKHNMEKVWGELLGG